jgi:hypothetical protein
MAVKPLVDIERRVPQNRAKIHVWALGGCDAVTSLTRVSSAGSLMIFAPRHTDHTRISLSP